MTNLNNSLDALEYIVNEHNVSQSYIDEKLEGRENVLDQESIIEDYDETPESISNNKEQLSIKEEKNDVTSAFSELNKPVYRLGLNKEDYAKVLLLSSLIAKRYNRHIGKHLPSEKLNNSFAISKFLNNSLFYKMGFIFFALIIWQFNVSVVSIILVVLLILCYVFALFLLIKTEKHIFKYITAIRNSMSKELLEEKVNILELVYEIVRTKNSTINRALKERLKSNYKIYIKEYKRNNKGVKVKHYVSYNDLLQLYEKDLYKKSVNAEDFIFRIVIEDIYKYLKRLEKKS